MEVCSTGNSAPASCPWANQNRRLLTAKVWRRSCTLGPCPRPPWEMRACHKNRRKLCPTLPSVSGWAGPAGPAGEDPLPLARLPGDLGMVAGEPGSQRLADGHLPVFAAFRVADVQHAGVDVDVVDAEQAGLGAAQSAGVDRAEQHWHDQVAQRNLAAVVAAVGLREQRRQLPVG